MVSRLILKQLAPVALSRNKYTNVKLGPPRLNVILKIYFEQISPPALRVTVVMTHLAWTSLIIKFMCYTVYNSVLYV